MCSDDASTLDNCGWLRQLCGCALFLDNHVRCHRMAQAEAWRSFPPSHRHMSFSCTLRPCRYEGVKMVVYIHGAECGNPNMAHVASPLTKQRSYDYDEVSYKFTRFMSPDPMGGHLLDPQTLNRYAYVRNNPLNLTDPTGLDFYLQCTDEKNHNGCTQVQIKGSSTATWVQADKNGNATIITSDSIRAGDNTATVDEHGVTINGKSQGIYFDNPASQTRDANGTVVDDRNPITLAGSSALKDFTITINGNCGGTCLSSGTWSYPGSLEDARATLYGRGSFSFPGEDEKADLGYGDHTYSTQHRFGASTCSFFSCRNSPHISVPNSWVPVPKDTVPQGFHVDAHGSFIGHQQDVQRKGVE